MSVNLQMIKICKIMDCPKIYRLPVNICADYLDFLPGMWETLKVSLENPKGVSTVTQDRTWDLRSESVV
jgi:hypothetical protein